MVLFAAGSCLLRRNQMLPENEVLDNGASEILKIALMPHVIVVSNICHC